MLYRGELSILGVTGITMTQLTAFPTITWVAIGYPLSTE